MGTDEYNKSCTHKFDLWEIFVEDNIILNIFPFEVCNFNQSLYFTESKETQNEIGKIYFKILVNNNDIIMLKTLSMIIVILIIQL